MKGRPTREPDLEGPAGAAWKVKPNPDESPDKRTWIEAYLLHVPGAHPMWDGWALSAVHLRSVPGMPPAEKRYPGAEYELLVLALNPEFPAPDPDRGLQKVRYMTPIDVCEQFHGVTDDQVHEMVGLFARAVVMGQLSPDQDHRRAWADTVRVTVEHYADLHGESLH